MDIKDYWRRSVAMKLIPDWPTVICCWHPGSRLWTIENENTGSSIIRDVVDDGGDDYFELRVRDNGVDLYPIEWRKPTEQDVGRMCWFLTAVGNITKSKLINIFPPGYGYLRAMGDIRTAQFCVVSDHGQIAPTKEAFNKVYGG